MRAALLLLITSAVSAELSTFNHGANNFIVEEYVHTPEEPKVLKYRKYKPDWKDLDSRPLPEWYDRAKIGIFLHWGVYSVPSVGYENLAAEWFWAFWNKGKAPAKNKIDRFMEDNYRPGFTYQDFAPMFTAEFFKPDDWANLFKLAGAKYVVLTSKHHEGYTLFPSKRSFSWNSVDLGPRRDLVGDLATAVRKRDLEFGVYHSLYEWYNPIYNEDSRNNFNTTNFVRNKLRPDIEQLIQDYEPSVLWADGDWATSSKYWNSTHLLAWLYNDSPVKDRVVVNDRWGTDTHCNHGDFYNCKDNYDPGTLRDHKWESAFTMDLHSWGYRRNMKFKDVRTIDDLLLRIIRTVSCGGNALINVGPTKEGTISPIFKERLLHLGKWLLINGPAIYSSSPWYHQNDTSNGNVWYTCTKTPYDAMHPTAAPKSTDNVTAIYALFAQWPADNVLKVKDLTSVLQGRDYKVQMLDGKHNLKWNIKNDQVNIELPDRAQVQSPYAWTLEVSHK